MIIYFALICLISVLYIALKNKRKLFFVLTGILFCIVVGLRDISVGVDTSNYVHMYLYNTENYINALEKNSVSLIGFFLNDYLYFIYCHILLSLGFNERMFLVMSTAIMAYLLLRFLYKYSENDYLCILSFIMIGMFTYLFSGIRQGIAVSLFTLSYDYIIDKKPWKFIIVTIIAMGFHISAIVTLPAYILVRILKKVKIEYSILMCCFLGFLTSDVIYFMLGRLNLGVRFSGYLCPDAVRTNPLVVVFYVCIAVLCTFLQKDKNADSSGYEVGKIFFTMYSIGVGIIIVSLRNTIISRFALYYLLVLPIVLANSIKQTRIVKNRIVYSVSCVAIEILYFMVSVPSSYLNIINYRFFWQ